MNLRLPRVAVASLVCALTCAATPLSAQTPRRPFGTLREQAVTQQRWLERRLTTVLPALMRTHGVDAGGIGRTDGQR